MGYTSLKILHINFISFNTKLTEIEPKGMILSHWVVQKTAQTVAQTSCYCSIYDPINSYLV